MQEKDYKEFDLQIRSMLEDAQEEVPQHVWDSVSASLDRQERKPVVLWWRRAAVGVAAAAAVAAGVFVSVRNDNSTSPYNQPTITATADAPKSSSDQDIDVVPAPSKEESLIARATEPQSSPSPSNLYSGTIPRSASQAVKASDAVAIETPSQEISTTQKNVEEVEKGEEKEIVAEKVTETPATVSKEKDLPQSTTQNPSAQESADSFQGDPFAELEGKDSRSKGNPSISFGGFTQSNGDPASSPAFGMSRASGSAVKTGVTQTSKESTYSMPISFGVGVRFPLSKSLSIGTGLTYSFMERTFQGLYTKVDDNGSVQTQINTEIHNGLHYVGIPLNLYYNFLSGDRLSLYGYGGGALEKGIANRFRINDGNNHILYKESVSGVQFSVGAGFGVGFKIIDNVSLYIDPSVRYFFDCNQPTSIRTQQPLMFNFEVGVRVDL